jgi:parallel beta-helix repeat protein
MGATSGCGFGSRPPGPWVSDTDGTTVTSRTELEAAFDDLSPGDTIRISDRNAPYRTTQWLDVDVDDVTVVGPGVETLIKPADGANVGGIRVGHEERCQRVRIHGVGYHGNPDGQREAADRLHGIAVRNATDVTVERNRIRHTHPRRHGDGGSGVSVARGCSDVWIRDNRIREYGDRGIQLGGKRITVAENTITDGLDRPVACDLWDSQRENYTARNVLIFGNVLGNAAEGSLVGIARNTPLASGDGHVNIFGNLGFGSHKSFCHVRGPEALQNISVRNNVSVQTIDGLRTEATTRFAGVAVDVARGRNVTIENNELHGYSGHGIHVDSDLSAVTIRQNTVSESGLAGVRLAGANAGVVDGNVVTRAGGAGIHLRDSTTVSVTDNYVRRTGAAGIVTAGPKTGAGNDVADNYVTGSGRAWSRSAPAIRVADAGTRVRGNTLRQNGAPAIVESRGARNNRYENNWADGDRPWRIAAPTSRVRHNAPVMGAHHDVSADASGVARIDFDKPYARPPPLTFGRIGGGVRDIAYEMDDDGHYVGATITVGDADATLDVFVDGA